MVLNVGMVADEDAVDVAAQHHAIPHARMRAERHVANDGGVFGDENIFAQCRFFAEKFIELRRQFVHAKNLTPILCSVEPVARKNRRKAPTLQLSPHEAAVAQFERTD